VGAGDEGEGDDDGEHGVGASDDGYGDGYY